MKDEVKSRGTTWDEDQVNKKGAIAEMSNNSRGYPFGMFIAESELNGDVKDGEFKASTTRAILETLLEPDVADAQCKWQARLVQDNSTIMSRSIVRMLSFVEEG